MSFVALMAMVFTTAPANADYLKPGSVSVSSGANPTKMIDGVGLSAESSAATARGWGTDVWLSGSPVASQWVTFDLAEPCNLTQAYIWQYWEGASWSKRGTRTMDILVSADGVSWTNLGTVTLSEGGNTAQVVPLVADGVRYVKFDILSSHGANAAGFAEVRFEGVIRLDPPGTVIIIR